MPRAAVDPSVAAGANGVRDERAAPPLALEGIVKHWPGVPHVLEGVDLTLESGTAVAIEGRNGAGKTTLLRIAAGLIAPEQGSVRVRGLDPERDRTEFHRRVGFLSAGNSGLYARLKAEHHLDMWARLALIPRRQRSGAIERVLGQFALEPLLGKRVDRLSMGQRQRLRLALSFLHDPEVILFDEPATSLDEDGMILLGSALDSLKARGGAALVCLPTGWDRLPAIDAVHGLADGRLEPA
ncbi:MAG: type transport system ATP-binding protein [Thermoleophilaceae bacterium]|nr:type transport system ATP-binding protein [Thermoleophilaceae bacterium]